MQEKLDGCLPVVTIKPLDSLITQAQNGLETGHMYKTRIKTSIPKDIKMLPFPNRFLFFNLSTLRGAYHNTATIFFVLKNRPFMRISCASLLILHLPANSAIFPSSSNFAKRIIIVSSSLIIHIL